jgi:hypothetical protein
MRGHQPQDDVAKSGYNTNRGIDNLEIMLHVVGQLVQPII